MLYFRTRYEKLFFFSVLYSHVIILNEMFTWVNADYCNLHSCGSNPHTMCRYPENGPSNNCKDYIASPLTHSEKIALVDKHNKFRKKVADGLEKRGKPGPQPKAINMTMLTWDEELANIAQRWADQCSSGHDKCRNVDRFNVGQNIATTWSTDKIHKKIEDLVDGWYLEVKFFSRYYVDKYKFGMSWGHYSQLVWAKTLTVGCGRVFFWDNARRMNTLRLICNYGPAGNFLRHPVYISHSNTFRPNSFLLFFTILILLLFYTKK